MSGKRPSSPGQGAGASSQPNRTSGAFRENAGALHQYQTTLTRPLSQQRRTPSTTATLLYSNVRPLQPYKGRPVHWFTLTRSAALGVVPEVVVVGVDGCVASAAGWAPVALPSLLGTLRSTASAFWSTNLVTKCCAMPSTMA